MRLTIYIPPKSESDEVWAGRSVYVDILRATQGYSLWSVRADLRRVWDSSVGSFLNLTHTTTPLTLTGFLSQREIRLEHRCLRSSIGLVPS